MTTAQAKAGENGKAAREFVGKATGLKPEAAAEPNRKILHEYLALESLFTDSCNARAPAGEKLPPLDAADPQLIASITADGIIVPLIVRAGGGVLAGRRRLAALLAMKKQGLIDGRQTVMCHLMELSDAGAREISLAENKHRLNMHPVEEHRAFASLATAGMEVEKIAQRHGITAREVEQSLRLGKVAPAILDAWRAGKVTKENVQAFSLSTDHAHQLKVYQRLNKSGALHRFAIRRELIGDDANAQKMLAFVDAEIYEVEGGKFARDLFTDSGQAEMIPENGELLKRLFDERMKKECDALIAKGWKFAEYDVQGRRHGLDRSPKAKPGPKFGCYLDVDHRGKLEVFTGYGEVKAARTGRAHIAGETEKPKKKPGALPASLERELEGQFASAVRFAVLRAAPSKHLMKVLAGVVAKLIEPSALGGMAFEVREKLQAIADAIDPKIMNQALRDEFDARDYFGRVAVDLARKQLIEAGIKGLDKVKRRDAFVKIARAQLAKTKWLPDALRTAGYDGPRAKR